MANSPYGFAGLRGMDAKIVQVLHDAFKKALDEPVHKAALGMGFHFPSGDPRDAPSGTPACDSAMARARPVMTSPCALIFKCRFKSAIRQNALQV